MFALDAVTGARQSEVLGLIWSDFDLGEVDDAIVRFTHQLSRSGERVPLKTSDSEGTVVLPRKTALMMLEHRARSGHCRGADFVFATRNGTAISQRNASKALRRAEVDATDDEDRPTFPELQEGQPVPRNTVPSWHSFRHTAASFALDAGDDVQEISWMLRHKDSTVTRQVYLHEIQSRERRGRARSKLEERYGAALDAATGRDDDEAVAA